MGNFSPVGAPGSSKAFSNTVTPSDHQALMTQLETFLPNAIFRTMHFHFDWQEFRRAHVNNFSDRLELQVTFEKLHYLLVAVHRGKHILKHQDIYQAPPSEDLIIQLLKISAEACLQLIKQHVHIQN
jgi:hypothetical protein